MNEEKADQSNAITNRFAQDRAYYKLVKLFNSSKYQFKENRFMEIGFINGSEELEMMKTLVDSSVDKTVEFDEIEFFDLELFAECVLEKAINDELFKMKCDYNLSINHEYSTEDWDKLFKLMVSVNHDKDEFRRVLSENKEFSLYYDSDVMATYLEHCKKMREKIKKKN